MRRLIVLLAATLHIGTALSLDEDGYTNENQKLVSMLEDTKLTVVESDILTFNRSESFRSSALNSGSARWPDGKVPVLFSNSFTEREKSKIILAMKEIHENTCVRFYHAANDDDDFLVIVKPVMKECSSMVGKQGGPQPVRLSSTCLARKIILHELMHALGFIHEHNRSDRDKYVTIKWGNIKEGESHNFDKRRFSELALMGTEYAYDSIMHYEGEEFAYSLLSPTIVSKKRGVKMGGGDHLSDIDTLRINKYYQCETSTTLTPEATTTTESPDELLPTTSAPTTTEPSKRIRACKDAYDDPSKDGQCRWLIMRTATDKTSDRHYLYCVPDNFSDDIRCGKWVRKECRRETKFDKALQFCRRTPFF